MVEAAARAVGLVKTYGRGDTAVRALDNVSVTFPARQFTAIMGPSGSGKSTLLHSAAGLDRPTSGTVHLGGTEISALKPRQLSAFRRDHVGFVFQAYNLLPALTVEDNITLPLRLGRRTLDSAWLETLLAADGALYVVHNSHLRYRDEVERRFATVEQVTRDKTFTVLRARP